MDVLLKQAVNETRRINCLKSGQWVELINEILEM